ncbi:hypothetical protein B0H13DRAFT_2342850 [Mycena leptocephala]|nr:hypothetical protein B0H13DRAFT_2342850 [Mycena leptocephala]
MFCAHPPPTYVFLRGVPSSNSPFAHFRDLLRRPRPHLGKLRRSANPTSETPPTCRPLSANFRPPAPPPPSTPGHLRDRLPPPPAHLRPPRTHLDATVLRGFLIALPYRAPVRPKHPALTTKRAHATRLFGAPSCNTFTCAKPSRLVPLPRRVCLQPHDTVLLFSPCPTPLCPRVLDLPALVLHHWNSGSVQTDAIAPSLWAIPVLLLPRFVPSFALSLFSFTLTSVHANDTFLFFSPSSAHAANPRRLARFSSSSPFSGMWKICEAAVLTRWIHTDRSTFPPVPFSYPVPFPSSLPFCVLLSLFAINPPCTRVPLCMCTARAAVCGSESSAIRVRYAHRAQSPPSAQRDDLAHGDHAISREQHRRRRRTSTNMCLCSSLATTTIARISDEPTRTARLTTPFQCARLALAPFDPHVGKRDESLAPHAAPLSPIACSTPVPRRTRLQPAPRHPRTSAASPPRPRHLCSTPLATKRQRCLRSHLFARAPHRTPDATPTKHPLSSVRLGSVATFTPLLPCPWATRLAHVIILPSASSRHRVGPERLVSGRDGVWRWGTGASGEWSRLPFTWTLARLSLKFSYTPPTPYHFPVTTVKFTALLDIHIDIISPAHRKAPLVNPLLSLDDPRGQSALPSPAVIHHDTSSVEITIARAYFLATHRPCRLSLAKLSPKHSS